ncbi:MAG: UPF0175 family protein [Candidatus Njordarchaeota archaeon]
MEKNTVTIRIQIPKTLREEIDAIASKLGVGREAILRDAIARGINLLKIEYAAWLYMKKKMSLGRAAEVAGISLWELIDFLNSNKVPLRYREEHVLRDLGD